MLTKNSAMFWGTKGMTFSFVAFSAQIYYYFFFIFFKLLIFAWFYGTPFEIIMVFSCFFLRRVGTSWGDLHYGETRWCSTWSGKFCSILHNLVLKNVFLVLVAEKAQAEEGNFNFETWIFRHVLLENVIALNIWNLCTPLSRSISCNYFIFGW